METNPFRSLRMRLLVPLLAASVLAAVLVALVSAWLGKRWATEYVDQRFARIERSLSTSSFPLTAPVLQLLSDLTDAALVTFRESGQLMESTLSLDAQAKTQLAEVARLVRAEQGLVRQHLSVTVGERSFLAYISQRLDPAVPNNAGRIVLVLFDQSQVEAMRWRAALLPLATGLSTVLVLGALSIYVTNRLIMRLKKLQRRVEVIAGGNFELRGSDPVRDEIGLLSSAVDSMARQLKNLWRAVQSQHSERLLHQVSGGIAHQLRNSLTGARLALEMYARDNACGEDEEIRVALQQVQQAEDYIRRLLLVALGQQDKDRSVSASECLHSVQSSLAPVAKHRRVELTWRFDHLLVNCYVKDGPTFIAAVNNLVLNAMQAGTAVLVTSEKASEDQLFVTISDDGPGVAENIASEIFEPFVTSKPEGMGLGLPLVQRAAEHLEGQVQWWREAHRTVFRLSVRSFEGRRVDGTNS